MLPIISEYTPVFHIGLKKMAMFYNHWRITDGEWKVFLFRSYNPIPDFVHALHQSISQ